MRWRILIGLLVVIASAPGHAAPCQGRRGELHLLRVHEDADLAFFAMSFRGRPKRDHAVALSCLHPLKDGVRPAVARRR